MDTASFQLCYNLHKYAPDRDFYLDRIQSRGLLQLMPPPPRARTLFDVLS
jgi:hypothetical protein